MNIIDIFCFIIDMINNYYSAYDHKSIALPERIMPLASLSCFEKHLPYWQLFY